MPHRRETHTRRIDGLNAFIAQLHKAGKDVDDFLRNVRERTVSPDFLKEVLGPNISKTNSAEFQQADAVKALQRYGFFRMLEPLSPHEPENNLPLAAFLHRKMGHEYPVKMFYDGSFHILHDGEPIDGRVIEGKPVHIFIGVRRVVREEIRDKLGGAYRLLPDNTLDGMMDGDSILRPYNAGKIQELLAPHVNRAENMAHDFAYVLGANQQTPQQNLNREFIQTTFSLPGESAPLLDVVKKLRAQTDYGGSIFLFDESSGIFYKLNGETHPTFPNAIQPLQNTPFKMPAQSRLSLYLQHNCKGVPIPPQTLIDAHSWAYKLLTPTRALGNAR